MYIVKRGKEYLILGVTERQFAETTKLATRATVFTEDTAINTAEAANKLFRTRGWEAIEL